MHRLRAAAIAAAVLVVPAALAGPALADPPDATPAATHADVHERAVCGAPEADSARCLAHVVEDGAGASPRTTTSPTGLKPGDITAAYGYPVTTTGTTAPGAGTTIAIVDAYDSKTVAGDLTTFDNAFGLAPCTTANGCFKKVNQTGGGKFPRADAGWALEIALDVEWAHAVAPGAHILLVEASTNSYTNLMAAVNYAKQHAGYVSMSWGSGEFSGESSYDNRFVQPGVSFFAAAGDSGLPAEYPSSSPNVVSVGGTRLQYTNGTLTGESGWSSGGGGCSLYEAAPAAQVTDSVNCAGLRATPDVSLDADPASGVSVYDSTAYSGQSGWFTVGGTSASTPMIAARSATVGATVDAAYLYGGGFTELRDIVNGNNGAPCLTGYDLCTGRGSWAASGAPTLG